MIVGLTGFMFPGGSGPSYPPYGTLLSSHCSGYSAQDAGNESYTDQAGGTWNGMFTLWQELADGVGGSFWYNNGSNSADEFSACWFPYGFCVSNTSGDENMNWEGCRSSGSFGPVSWYVNQDFSDGAGGTYSNNDSGYYDPPTAGDIIYQSGAGNCCTVYYDGGGIYIVDDTCGGGCDPAGTFLYNGCESSSGYDAAGTYFYGTWLYGSFYADGECGTYFELIGEDTDGCYYPAGWRFDYETDPVYSLYWDVSDSSDNPVSAGTAIYYYAWYSSQVADGSGGRYSDSGEWNLSDNAVITDGYYFDDNLGYTVFYQVFYDNAGGYYVVQNPAEA
jgi:hypothetical protein